MVSPPMKTHEKIGGSAWIPSLIAMVVIGLFVLVVFGATPSGLLQIPQTAFNNLKPAPKPDAAASPDAAPSASPAASVPAVTATPTPPPPANPLGTPGGLK